MLSKMVIHQLQVFAYAFLWGVACTILYDLIRIFRRICKHSIIGIMIEDFIFWTIMTITSLASIFYIDNGAIRSYMLCGVCAGVIVYECILGHHVVVWISRMIQKINKKIIKFIGNNLKKSNKQARIDKDRKECGDRNDTKTDKK